MTRYTEYLQFLLKKIFSPPILILTLTGNALILIFSLIFYFTEAGRNEEIKHLFDAVWWAFSTVTTVGYGDLVPSTTAGRVISIFLMLMGTGLFVAHTALLANAFLDRKFLLFFNKKDKTEKEVAQKAVRQREVILEEEKDIHHILTEIKDRMDYLEKRLKAQKKSGASSKESANK